MRTSIGLTLVDPQVQKLEEAVWEWWVRFVTGDRPCWLTLCGPSGTGKTHCARWIWKTAFRKNLTDAKTAEYMTEFIWWPDLMARIRAGNAWEQVQDIKNWPLLVLDEVGASRDTTGFTADQLYYILGQRENKWTVITSNLSLRSFCEMDARITSRMTRNGGIALEVNTQDYGTR